MIEIVEREPEQPHRPPWTLQVRDGNVVCARTVPYEGQIIYSTADIRNRPDKQSRYRLSERDVVRHYVEHAQTDTPFPRLVDAVQRALAEQWDSAEGVA